MLTVIKQRLNCLISSSTIVTSPTNQNFWFVGLVTIVEEDIKQLRRCLNTVWYFFSRSSVLVPYCHVHWSRTCTYKIKRIFKWELCLLTDVNGGFWNFPASIKLKTVVTQQKKKVCSVKAILYSDRGYRSFLWNRVINNGCIIICLYCFLDSMQLYNGKIMNIYMFDETHKLQLINFVLIL